MADTDPGYPRSSIEDDFNYGSCVASASVHIRMAFLRKVYSILSLQVLLTTVTSALFLYFQALRTFVHESPALIVVFALGSLGLIFALTLHRHTHPLNLYLLFAFTLSESLAVAAVVTFYDVYLVLQAFIMTTAVFLGLTAYTLQSKRDFTKFGAGLFAGLWILCLAGFLKLFFYSETMELVLASLGALLFCGFIIYDTHSLMHRLSPEEYVIAAISLYMDIINLFLHLLKFLEAVNKKCRGQPKPRDDRDSWLTTPPQRPRLSRIPACCALAPERKPEAPVLPVGVPRVVRGVVSQPPHGSRDLYGVQQSGGPGGSGSAPQSADGDGSSGLKPNLVERS